MLTMLFVSPSLAQLRPGFDRTEFLGLLGICARQGDTPWVNVKIPVPEGFVIAYRSPVTGLDNRWDLWINESSRTAVLSIRATQATAASWLENIFAGMVPATGRIMMDSVQTFEYRLASDSAALIHAGWLLGLAGMAPEINRMVFNYYQKGYRDFLIMGHSQGAALAFLVRSYLYYNPDIPQDIRFKTYCSAAPKPGNLYYAYDFENINRQGWAFRVVNREDWVPEAPFSIQTFSDVNEVNPLKMLHQKPKKGNKASIWYAKMVARSLGNKTRKAQKAYTRKLGKLVSRFVYKKLPIRSHFTFAPSFNYSVCGAPIVLKPDESYFLKYPQNGNIFVHHMLAPYYDLVNSNFPE